MYQLLEFEEAIPSCEIYSMKYDKENDKWKFIYAVDTPFELKTKEQLIKEGYREDLNDVPYVIIYEFISDLILKEMDNAIHPESINIKLKTLDEYKFWLTEQRKADFKYREDYYKENPEFFENNIPGIVILEKRDYSNEELLSDDMIYKAHYIVRELNGKEELERYYEDVKYNNKRNIMRGIYDPENDKEFKLINLEDFKEKYTIFIGV